MPGSASSPGKTRLSRVAASASIAPQKLRFYSATRSARPSNPCHVRNASKICKKIEISAFPQYNFRMTLYVNCCARKNSRTDALVTKFNENGLPAGLCRRKCGKNYRRNKEKNRKADIKNEFKKQRFATRIQSD